MLEGLYVEVHGKDDFERAYSRFKKKVKNSNLFLEIEYNSYYRKPSEIRRMKKHSAKRREYVKNRENSK